MSKSDFWTQQADRAGREAREAAGKARERRQRLANGTSQDREADRYLAREAEADQSVAAANERDFRAMAPKRTWGRRKR